MPNTGRTRNEALRDAWFRAAVEILETEGYGGLKLAPLCNRMGVTTGAFYHSFTNWQEFTSGLLDAWFIRRTQETVDLVSQYDDPVIRLRMLIEASGELDHGAEAAIRVWSGVDERVLAIQRKVDEGRLAVVRDAMTALVGAERAEAFTLWGVSTLIGFETVAADQSGDQSGNHLRWALQQVLAAAAQAGGVSLDSGIPITNTAPHA